MFLYHNHLLPSSFHMIFTTGSQMHINNTRHAADYRTHACRTNIKQFTILFQGPKLWNSLPKNIINQVTPRCFRNRMLEHLLY